MLTVPRVLGALISLALLAYVFVFADAINDDGANDADRDGSAVLPASEEVPVKTPDEPRSEFPKPGQVFVGAMTEAEGRTLMVLNLRAFDPPPEGLPAARPMTYDGESTGDRSARRFARWTPFRS